MEDIGYAAIQAVRTCLDFKPSERMVVIYDNSSSKIAQQIIRESKRITGNVEAFLMESYGARSKDGENPLQFPNEIKDALRGAEVSFYIAGDTFPGEFESFRKPMIDIVNTNSRLRHAHSPGITEEAFLSGMFVDYRKVRDLTKKIHEMVRDAKRIRVTTHVGSDFIAEFSPEYKWIVDDGFPTSERWLNLPGGETFTTPSNLNGRVVIDGVLGDYFDKKYRFIMIIVL